MLATLAALLGAATIAVPITRRFGFGSVLGYLLAGIAIGPVGLRLITDVGQIAGISGLGVIMLLFLIGLELRPQRLWVMRKAVFGLGPAQVVVTGGVLAVLAHGAGLDWPAASVLGAGLALSSTAIVLPLLAERDLLGTRAGRDAFAVLLFQDLAFIPMVAILPALASGDVPDRVPWVDVAKGAAAIAIILGGGRFLLRPLLRVVGGLQDARGVHRGGAADRGRHRRPVRGGRIVDVPRRVSRRGAAVGFRISPRVAGGHRAVRGLAARLLLHLGRHVRGRPSRGSASGGADRRRSGTRRRKRRSHSGSAGSPASPIAHALRFAAALPQGSEFSFVLFGAAVGAKAMSPTLADFATLLVAASMIATRRAVRGLGGAADPAPAAPARARIRCDRRRDGAGHHLRLRPGRADRRPGAADASHRLHRAREGFRPGRGRAPVRHARLLRRSYPRRTCSGPRARSRPG